MPEMRAVIFDRYGPPDVLRVARVPRPEAGPRQVLVRVLATSVNGGEVQGRAGRLKLVLGNRFPKRLGVDLVGVVAGIGADVRGLTVGESVWGVSENPMGTNADYFSIGPERLSRAPASLTPAEAVTLLAGGTTVITAFRDKVALQPGERLLVRGAAGGVGSVAVQLGKLYGAHVTAIARTEALDFVRGLGADVVIDYTRTDLAGLDRFDVILDTAGSQLRTLPGLLTPAGRMVAVTIDMNHRVASLGAIAASAVHGSRRIRIFRGSPRTALLSELAGLAVRGDVRPVLDRTFALDQIADAHRALEAGGVLGKLVIEIG